VASKARLISKLSPLNNEPGSPPSGRGCVTEINERGRDQQAIEADEGAAAEP
jgi:hypothetical protein